MAGSPLPSYGDPRRGELPLRNAILGGTEIGEDLGYGSARYLTPEEVKEVSAALSEISKEDLEKRYNAQEMEDEDIYPGYWARDEENLESILHSFEDLKNFYEDASEKGNAVLLYIT